MRRLRFKTVVIGFLGLAVVAGGYFIWTWSRTRWIPAGYVGVIYDAGGGLRKEVIPPRAVTVGWRQQLFIYPTKLQNAIYSQDPLAGEVKAPDGIQVTTNDNASTIFDVSVVYRVRPEDVVRVFNEFGAIPIEDIQALHIRRAVKEVVNDIGTRYDLFSLMGTKRQEASQLMTEGLRQRLGPKGLTIVSAMLMNAYPGQDFQSKITSRVNAYVDLDISTLRQQIADIDRQTANIRAKAETEAGQLNAAQTAGRSMDMLTLEAQEEAIRKWDGRLPTVVMKPGQTVVLGKDSLMQVPGVRR